MALVTTVAYKAECGDQRVGRAVSEPTKFVRFSRRNALVGLRISDSLEQVLQRLAVVVACDLSPRTTLATATSRGAPWTYLERTAVSGPSIDDEVDGASLRPSPTAPAGPSVTPTNCPARSSRLLDP